MTRIFNQTSVVVTAKDDFTVEKVGASTQVQISDQGGNNVTLVMSDEAKLHLVAELLKPEMSDLQGKTVRIFGIPKKLLDDLGVRL